METIQVVIDTELREAADKAAKEQKMNRSALMREALRGHLKKLRIEAMEERDRRAYEKYPETRDEKDEGELWEREAVWPEE